MGHQGIRKAGTVSMAAMAMFITFGLMAPDNTGAETQAKYTTMACEPRWESPLAGKETKFGTASDIYNRALYWAG